MAKSSRGGRRGGVAPNPGKGASIAQSNTPAKQTGNLNTTQTRSYQNMDDNDASAIISANADSYQDPDFVSAQKMYISDAIDSQGYSYSQSMNYKLDNGLPLNATEKWINNNLQNGMHDLGKDTNLVRYCHDDILQKCGISDYSKLSDSQLQSKLIGTELKTTAYMSTSYNAKKSPFAPGQPLGGGREVVMNIKASSTSKVIFGAKAQSEIVMNKGTNLRIIGIHYDGSYATPRNKGSRPRIVLDVETF
jgi:hypothetical protein